MSIHLEEEEKLKTSLRTRNTAEAISRPRTIMGFSDCGSGKKKRVIGNILGFDSRRRQ